VIEYLLAELILASGKIANKENPHIVHIEPHHIFEAIQSDKELRLLFAPTISPNMQPANGLTISMIVILNV
jgi:hypothetical protein